MLLDNEICMSDDDRQLGQDVFEKTRFSIGCGDNIVNKTGGDDIMDPLCIVYMIHPLEIGCVIILQTRFIEHMSPNKQYTVLVEKIVRPRVASTN